MNISSEQDLCYLSAGEAMRLFRARKLSPVELLQALIDRAEAVEPKINAFAFTYYDEVLEKARKAEAKFAKTDGRGQAKKRSNPWGRWRLFATIRVEPA